jgi:myo-inositol-1(or 4)-monophosphatase
MFPANDLTASMPALADAVLAAGSTLRQRFQNAAALPFDLRTLIAAVDANDAAVAGTLRAALLAIRPGSRWVEDEEEGGRLPAGEWWIADPVEGNVNHVHGGAAWGVTATLVRDGEPVLAVVYEPLRERVYTAAKGGGAYCNGTRLQVSGKDDLRAAVVATGQARPGEGRAVHAAIGASVQAMLDTALLVRMAVPATFEIADVASGRMDAFWQYTQVRSGLAAGVLLVSEAGGIVTDTRGQPWNFASADILLAAPGVHAAAVACLASARLEVAR